MPVVDDTIIISNTFASRRSNLPHPLDLKLVGHNFPPPLSITMSSCPNVQYTFSSMLAMSIQLEMAGNRILSKSPNFKVEDLES
jgi:hypothetical protein